MTKGKPWTVEEEKQLRDLVEAKNSVSVIAKKLGKTGDAVVQKCYRLSLEVEGVKKNNSVPPSSSNVGLKLPAELGSVEETLLMLSGALASLRRGGLDKVEILRLRGLIAGCKVFAFNSRYLGFFHAPSVAETR